ncbi:MAG: acyl-CoA dehydrogenase [Chloroflexi bacterium]|nr:acyl-CoA dehydrogenase [Chloroflexota bacterium]
MDFELTDEQREMRDMARRFAEKEIRPVAAKYDEREEVPWKVIEKAAEAGFFSYYLPKRYGGGDITDKVTQALVNEELAWGCTGIRSILGATALAAIPILLAGTDDQKFKFLSEFSFDRKPAIGAFALTEPSAGSDAASLAAEAWRDGRHYIINGYKHFITNAPIADIFVIFATVDISRGHRGITAFIVEKDTPGLIIGQKEKKLGIRSSPTATIAFEDMRVPVENRLGAEGEGFKLAMKTFEITRTHIAAAGVGLARAAYEYALQYAQGRVQFGKLIIQHQAIAFMLANMATQIDAARLLTWRAARLADQGKPCTQEASMAKLFAGDAAMQVTTDAVQVLGGYGFIRDYPVEKWMRDAKILQIYEGTSQIQRLIIARHLAG